MSLYADTPRWPRHGHLWGHLISDTSLQELHCAAAKIGLHPRSFDLDHYDWPLECKADLEAAGVCFVTSGELARTLIGSGLRIPLKERGAARWRRTESDLNKLGLAPQFTTTDSEGERWTVQVIDFVLGERGHADALSSVQQSSHRGPGDDQQGSSEKPPGVQCAVRLGAEPGEPAWYTCTSDTPTIERAARALISTLEERDPEFVGQMLARLESA